MDFWRLLYKDDGEGISSTNAEKVLAHFFTTNRNKGGTGLGLGIAKSLVEAHKGSIFLEPGIDGAVFRVRLLCSGLCTNSLEKSCPKF